MSILPQGVPKSAKLVFGKAKIHNSVISETFKVPAPGGADEISHFHKMAKFGLAFGGFRTFWR